MMDKIKYHSSLSEKPLIKTPEISHVNSNWEHVYEPAEDTFLLLDALEKDLKFINFMKPKFVLEVGSGAGLIITALSKTLDSTSHCLAIDINPHACKLTKSTANHNCAIVDVVQADLTTCLKKFFIDMIIFNPPYVVTPSNELNTNDFLTKSWAGGNNGREVIDKFLSKLVETMSQESFGYLLVLKENQPQDIIRKLTNENFVSEIFAKRKIRGEELFIIKFVKGN